jgi:hypothetical protein
MEDSHPRYFVPLPKHVRHTTGKSCLGGAGNFDSHPRRGRELYYCCELYVGGKNSIIPMDERQLGRMTFFFQGTWYLDPLKPGT